MADQKIRPPVVNEQLTDTTYTGVVVWFNYRTGFGYIKPDAPIVIDGKNVFEKRDVFVHYTAISDNLAFIREGKEPFRKLLHDQKVKFQLGKNRVGYVAINVDQADGEPNAAEEWDKAHPAPVAEEAAPAQA